MQAGHERALGSGESERADGDLASGVTDLLDGARRETLCWGWSGGVWFVAIAIGANGLALAVGLSDGGCGWVSGFVILFLLNVFVAPVAALVAGVLAIVRLVWTSGRDVVAWIVLLIALASIVMSGWMYVYAGEAIGVV